MHYSEMVIEASGFKRASGADNRTLGRFTVRVISSPAGETQPEDAVPVEFDYGQLLTQLRRLDARQFDQAGLIELGRTLALLLLPPAEEGSPANLRGLFAASLRQVGQEGGLRLRLRLPLALSVVPWEFIYVDRAGGGGGMDGFLALDPKVAIVRHEALLAPTSLPQARGTIKVVVALASALDLPPLDLAREKQDIEEALRDQPGIQAVYVEDATLDKLLPVLPGAGIFHFAGHGVFTREMADLPGTYSGVGALALGDEFVTAEQLSINLRNNGVRLAVLAGCETGRRDGINVWSGIAPALVKSEIPAVVANQYSISDPCAIAFSRQFYRALVGGLPIERAVTAGRIAAYNADTGGRDWGVPVLYLRPADGQLFEGASDPAVREQARAAAEAQVHVRANEVAAGGKVLGAEVRAMLAGKLGINVEIKGTVYGKVVGLKLDRLSGGSLNVSTSADTVGPGGSLTGAKIDTLG